MELDAGGIERERLIELLGDDFNTPGALALFHEWRSRGQAASLRWGLGLFGLDSLATDAVAPAEIVQLAELRQQARAGRDFREADRLRDELDGLGWVVRDVADGFQLVPRR
jgi:cysteinyl-tRNA synthetase